MKRDSQQYRLFILGAGFSRPAGLPLASELWLEVVRRARRLRGRAEQFSDDLKTYVEYLRACDGIAVEPEDIDFEQFLAFLDLEHHLKLRGSDTWSRDGNETQVVVKTLIGQILAEATPAPNAIPQLYLDFAASLQPSDYVLTFNYDVLLERALEAVRKPFRLFPSRLRNVTPMGAEVDTSHEEVVLLKLHGSIDWFDRTDYSERERDWPKDAKHSKPSHPIFADPDEFEAVPLVEGPRFPHDALREMYRVRRVRQLYQRGFLFHCAPWLLNPSSAKMLYAATVRDFWYGMGSAGLWNFGLAIIGFSLPIHDDYMRQVLYRIVTNYQQANWGKRVLGRRKTPLVLIDARSSKAGKEELESRYSFVDWNKAVTSLKGFTQQTLKLMFPT
ncbi:MAG TPA: SIR2 family protein [Terriglobales bacterium]|nr:SIR2 family protein [Terriglobales bacterium]